MSAKSESFVSFLEPMKNSSPREKPPLEEDISIHILSVSAAMVGVCLTVIGLIRIVITIGKFDTIADDLLAVASLIFLVSCFCSYWALRTRGARRMHTAGTHRRCLVSFGAIAHGRRLRNYCLRDDLIPPPGDERRLLEFDQA